MSPAHAGDNSRDAHYDDRRRFGETDPPSGQPIPRALLRRRKRKAWTASAAGVALIIVTLLHAINSRRTAVLHHAMTQFNRSAFPLASTVPWWVGGWMLRETHRDPLIVWIARWWVQMTATDGAHPWQTCRYRRKLVPLTSLFVEYFTVLGFKLCGKLQWWLLVSIQRVLEILDGHQWARACLKPHNIDRTK